MAFLASVRHNTEVLIIGFHQDVGASQMNLIGAQGTMYHQELIFNLGNLADLEARQ